MKKILITVGAVLGCAVGLVLAAPSLVDWTAYKDEIAARVSEATGRPLELAGKIRLSLLPLPTLAVRDVRLAGPPGAAEPVMARLKELDVTVALWPLLSGRIQVESVTMVEPEFVFEVLPDGRFNWDFNATRATPAAGPLPTGGLAGAISFDQVSVENGTVIYRDSARSQPERIEQVNARVVATSLNGPLQAQGTFALRGMPLRGEVNVGRLSEGAAASLRVGVMTPEGDSAVRFAGIVTSAGAGTGTGIRVQGELRAEGDDLARTGTALEPVIGKALIGVPPLPFTLKAVVEAVPGSVRLSSLESVVGDTRTTGSAAYRAGEPAQADVNVTLNRVDLDGWLKRSAQSPASTASGLGAITGASGAAKTKAAARAAAFPTDLDAHVTIGVEALGWNGAVIQKLRMEGALDGGTVKLDRLSALLPGGADVAMGGEITLADGQPSGTLRVAVNADNLRGLLDWLRVDTGGVPADRLRKAAAEATVRIRPGQVEVGGLDLTLDASRAAGGFTYVYGGRQALGIKLDVDRFNLDAYRPAAATAPAATGATRALGPVATANGSSQTLAERVLGGFDANLDLAVGELTVNGLSLDGVRLDATAAKGALTIREARVNDLAGVSARIDGYLAGMAPVRGADLRVTARADSLAGVARALPWPAGAPSPERLGAVTLNGRLTGDPGAVGVELDLAAAGGTLQAGGTLKDLARMPEAALSVRATHPDMARLIGLFGEGATALNGALDLYGEVTASAGAVVVKGIQGNVAGTAVTGQAVATLGGERPRIEASLQTGDVDLDRLTAVRPPPPAGGVAVPAAPRPTMADDAVPVDWLRRFDGRLSLTAAAITAGGWRLEEPALSAGLEGGVLSLDQLDGRVMGGRLGASGRLSAPPDQTPTASLSLTLVKLRPEGAMAGWPLGIGGGTLDADLDLTTVGGSRQAMLLGLAGTGSVTARDGMLKGVDFTALGDRLGRLERPQDALEAMVAALKGGDTPFASLTGTITIDHGIARSEDMRLTAPVGDAAGVGEVDLSAGTLDARVRVAARADAAVPPVTLRLSGPLEAPTRSFEMTEVQAFLARRAAGAAELPASGDLLRGLLDGLRR